MDIKTKIIGKRKSVQITNLKNIFPETREKKRIENNKVCYSLKIL
jgi:hypothetical protein